MLKKRDPREEVARTLYEASPQSAFDPQDPKTFWMAEDGYWPPLSDASVWETWFSLADRILALPVLRTEAKPLDGSTRPTFRAIGPRSERTGQWASSLAKTVRVMAKRTEELEAGLLNLMLAEQASREMGDKRYTRHAKKRVAGANPWGEGATTLEWQLSSPPPFHQWEQLPRIK